MDDSFVCVKTPQGHVLVSRELLSLRSHDPDQLHQHCSLPNLTPPNIHPGEELQYSPVPLTTTAPSSCYADFCPAPMLGLGLGYNKSEAVGFAPQESSSLQSSVGYCFAGNQAIETFSNGELNLAAASPTCNAQTTSCLKLEEEQTDAVSMNPCGGSGQHGLQPNTRLREGNGHDSDNIAAQNETYCSQQAAFSTGYQGVGMPDSPRTPRDEAVDSHHSKSAHAIRDQRKLEPGQSLYVHVTHRENDSEPEISRKRNYVPSSFDLSAECMSRRQTAFANVPSTYDNQKQPRRMSRIQGNLLHLEQQQRMRVKQQLNAISDSNHDT